MKVFVIGCIFFAIACAQQEQKCPADQEYKTCGSACAPKCNQTRVKRCALYCVEGCFCKQGLVKDDKGNCIDRKNCPNLCPKPYQKWNTCDTACEPSCKMPKPEGCTDQCVQGCFCEQGYIKDDQGNCIDEKDCPSTYN